MLSVTIKGFQSIEEVSFSIDGFTALVGRSNIGKSAVVRAVHAALTNALGTDFVRHGEMCSRRIRGTKKCRCQASVHLLQEGLDLLWEKGDEVNQYIYNGQVFTRVDRGTPDFLIKDFSLTKVGDRKQLIQVAEQFDPIFLLSQSGTVVADVLSDVAKLDDINLAMADVEKDRREAASTLKVRERDIQQLQASLTQYEGLDEPVALAQRVSEKFQAISVLVTQEKELEQFCSRLQEVGDSLRTLQGVGDINPPDVEPLEASERAFSTLVGYRAALDEKTASVESLEPVEVLPVPDSPSLEEASAGAIQVAEWEVRVDALKGPLLAWREVEKVKEPEDDNLQGVPVLVQLLSWCSLVQAGTSVVEELELVDLMPELRDDLAPESEIVLQLATFSERHVTMDTSLEMLTTEVAEAENLELALREEWSALGVCPTCSQSLEEGHTLHV